MPCFQLKRYLWSLEAIILEPDDACREEGDCVIHGEDPSLETSDPSMMILLGGFVHYLSDSVDSIIYHLSE